MLPSSEIDPNSMSLSTALSFTSPTEISNVSEVVRPPESVAVTVTETESASS